MLAVKDYDEQAMKQNVVAWKDSYNDVERFISIFNWMNGRENHEDPREFYKYERCLLLLVDFSLDPPKIYETIEDLLQNGIVSQEFTDDFARLSPVNFSGDLVNAYLQRYPAQ